MKKLFSALLVSLLFVFVLAACAPQGVAQGFVALPDNIQVSITGLVVAVVAFAFNWVIGIAPWLKFLRAYEQEWSLALSALVISWLQNLLPTGYEDVSIKGVAFLLALIFAFVPYMLARKTAIRKGLNGFAGRVKA